MTRHYPRGVRRDRFDEWCRALSPSRELLRSYRSGATPWAGFEEAFLAELGASCGARDALLALRARAASGEVTLLCYEKEGLPCHRHVVKAVLDRNILLA